MRSTKSEATRRLGSVIAPLSSAEKQRAIAAVAAYILADAGADARFRVLGAELRIDKPANPDELPIRLIQVLAVEYDRRRNLDFTVTTRGKIVQVADSPSIQPTFHNDEIREARDIAERNEQVASVVQVQGAFASPFVPIRDAEQHNRLIGLHYAAVRRNLPAQFLGTAVVDLSERRLVSFEAAQTEGR
jgi:hypothetical protein